LICDDEIIVNPGGTNASLVALDCATGRTLWTTPARPRRHSAFICAEFGDRRQIIGHDRQSLGGWDVKPASAFGDSFLTEGDFNVPTPIAVDGGILVSTENNGTGFYRFDNRPNYPPTGSAISRPDTHNRNSCGNLRPCIRRVSGLHCLDIHKGAQTHLACRRRNSGRARVVLRG
jgi:hypothetical protein